MGIEANQVELASPAVVQQSARDFAVALAGTPQFKAYEAAEQQLREDVAARRAMEAYQAKQQSLQALLMLNAVAPEEQAELERLRKAFLAERSVAAYFAAEADLRSLCQAAAAALSDHVGLDFAAACRTGCC